MACSDSNLRIFDITNPLAPVTKGAIATGAYASSVTVSGNYAYVTCLTGNTLQIFNVSNPNSPTLAAGIGTDNGPINLTLNGNYAYVACSGGNTLEIFNVSNPAGPTFVSRVTTNATPYDVKVVSNYAYVANLNAQTLQTIRVTNPALPAVINTLNVGYGLTTLAVSGFNLYVGGSNGYFASFDTAGSFPVLLKSTLLPSNGTVDSITVDNGAIYAAVTTPGALEVIVESNGLSIPDFTVSNVLTASNIVGAAGAVNVRGQLNLDPNGTNMGTLANGLVFGAATSGEGFASKRSTGGNQNGLDLYTNFTPRLSVSNGGAVGIGTTTPASTLEVDGDIRVTIANKPYVFSYDSAGGYFYIDEFGSGRRFAIKNGGNVGIGTTTPGYLLDVNGSLRCFSFTNSSDVRFKKNIADLADPLDSLLGLRGVSYEWRKGEFKETQMADGKQFGFIAQEVEKIFPDLVSTDAKGYKSVNYLGVIPVAVEAIKTLKAKNDALEAKLDAVLKRLDALESHSK